MLLAILWTPFREHLYDGRKILKESLKVKTFHLDSSTAISHHKC